MHPRRSREAQPSRLDPRGAVRSRRPRPRLRRSGFRPRLQAALELGSTPASAAVLDVVAVEGCRAEEGAAGAVVDSNSGSSRLFYRTILPLCRIAGAPVALS